MTLVGKRIKDRWKANVPCVRLGRIPTASFNTIGTTPSSQPLLAYAVCKFVEGLCDWCWMRMDPPVRGQ